MKTAGLLGGAMALGRGAMNFGKGLLGFGAMGGSGVTGKAMNVAGKVTGVAAPIVGTLGATAAQDGPSLNIMGQQVGGGSRAGSQAGAHYAEELVKAAGLTVLSRSEKQASVQEKILHALPDLLSYGAMIGAKFVDPVKHPWVHQGLDYGGLAGLGASTAYDMHKNPGMKSYKPGLKDLAGLALFASGVHDRSKAGH